MKVLLIEPYYKREIVPFSIMKFSTYYKRKGYEVKYVRTNNVGLFRNYNPDIIEVTSLFSWDLPVVCDAVVSAKKTFPTAKIRVGGIAATYNWKYVHEKTGIMPHKGLIKELEGIPLDYSLFPEIDYSLTFTSRGCLRNCAFCIVHVHEPDYIEVEDWEQQINYDSKHIILMDNNFLACKKPHFDKVIDTLVDYGKTVDFNQSLDARLMTDYKAKRLCELHHKPLRFAFDNSTYEKHVRNAVALMEKYGFDKRYIHYLLLYNWEDTQEDAHRRCKIVQDELEGMPYAMRYNPLDTLVKNEYVGKHWTQEEATKFRAYWNVQTVSKACSYKEYNKATMKEKQAHKKVIRDEKQKMLW